MASGDKMRRVVLAFWGQAVTFDDHDYKKALQALLHQNEHRIVEAEDMEKKEGLRL
jgi:hypothetical protein